MSNNKWFVWDCDGAQMNDTPLDTQEAAQSLADDLELEDHSLYHVGQMADK